MAEVGLDKRLLGAYVKAYRTYAGFKNVSEFSAAIADLTGIDIDGQTIYRIEVGKNPPKLETIMAIGRTLALCDMPVSLFDDIERCMTYKEEPCQSIE